MVASTRQIEFLARAIVNRLEDRGLVEFGDAEAGIDVVMRVLADNFKSLDVIVSEARQRLTVGGKEPSMDELEAEVRRIGTERGLIV
jgi:hypothetical protein